MLAAGIVSQSALVWQTNSPRWIPITNIVPLPPVTILAPQEAAGDLDYLAAAAHSSAPQRVRRVSYSRAATCPFCKEQIIPGARKCRHCGSDFSYTEKSDLAAGCLGFLLGPVGLWYKGHWAAGFAWLAMAIIFGVASGGLLAPVFWIGMGVHAAVAKPKG